MERFINEFVFAGIMTVFEQGYMGTPNNPGLLRVILEQEGIRVGDYNANRIDTLLALEEHGRIIRNILPDITIADLKKYAGIEGIDLTPYEKSLNVRMIDGGKRKPANEFRAGDVINRLRKHHDRTNNERYRTHARIIGNLLDRIRLIELSKMVEIMDEDQIIVLPYYIHETDKKNDHSLMPDDLEHHLKRHHRFADTPRRKRKKYDPLVVGKVDRNKAEDTKYGLIKLFEKIEKSGPKGKTKIKPGQYFSDLAIGMTVDSGHIRFSLVSALEAAENFLTHIHYGKQPSIPYKGHAKDIKEDGLSLRLNRVAGSNQNHDIVLDRLPVKIPNSKARDYYSNWTSIVADHSCDDTKDMRDKLRHQTSSDTYFCKHILESIMWAAYEINHTDYEATIPIIPVPIFSKDLVDFYRKLKYRVFIDKDEKGRPKPLNKAEMSGLLFDYVRRHPDCLGGKDFWKYYTPEIEQEMQSKLPKITGPLKNTINWMINKHREVGQYLQKYKTRRWNSDKKCALNTRKAMTHVAKDLHDKYGYNFMNPYTCQLFKKALQKQ